MFLHLAHVFVLFELEEKLSTRFFFCFFLINDQRIEYAVNNATIKMDYNVFYNGPQYKNLPNYPQLTGKEF